jgi:hypothetical protein
LQIHFCWKHGLESHSKNDDIIMAYPRGLPADKIIIIVLDVATKEFRPCLTAEKKGKGRQVKQRLRDGHG